jgi:cytochrome b subunit of formate dehydrogenase
MGAIVSALLIVGVPTTAEPARDPALALAHTALSAEAPSQRDEIQSSTPHRAPALSSRPNAEQDLGAGDRRAGAANVEAASNSVQWFERAKDFYTDEWVPQKLAWEIVAIALFLVLAYAGLHLLRRGLGPPIPRDRAAPPPPGARDFERFELGARLYHWGNFALIAGLLLSGSTFFLPGALFPLQPIFGFSWLTVHVVLALLFIIGVALHIVFAFVRADPHSMWFERRDWRDMGRLARYYIGASETIPKYGKYDVWQKLFHAFLALLALTVIVTGASLTINAEVLATLDQDWIRYQRLFHDAAAALFAAVVLGHVYQRLLKLNWPKLAAMFTGTISASEFRRAHDWNRWHAKAAAETASAAEPTPERQVGGATQGAPAEPAKAAASDAKRRSTRSTSRPDEG